MMFWLFYYCHSFEWNKIYDCLLYSGDDEQDPVDMPPRSQAPLGPILKKPANTSTPTQDPNISKNLGTVPLRQSYTGDQFRASGSYESQHLISSFGYNALPVKEWWVYKVLVLSEFTGYAMVFFFIHYLFKVTIKNIWSLSLIYIFYLKIYLKSYFLFSFMWF